MGDASYFKYGEDKTHMRTVIWTLKAEVLVTGPGCDKCYGGISFHYLYYCLLEKNMGDFFFLRS